MGKKKKRGSDRFTAPVKEAQIGGCYVNEDEDEKHDMQIEAIDELRKQNAHLASSANNHKTELIGVKEELLNATKTIDKLRKETETLKRANIESKQQQNKIQKEYAAQRDKDRVRTEKESEKSLMAQ
eukprot:730462_1